MVSPSVYCEFWNLKLPSETFTIQAGDDSKADITASFKCKTLQNCCGILLCKSAFWKICTSHSFYLHKRKTWQNCFLLSKTTSLQKIQNRTIISVEEEGYRKKIFPALKLSPSPSAYAVQRGQGLLACILSPWAIFRTEVKFLQLQIHRGSLVRSSSNYRNRLCIAVDRSRTTQNTG